MSSTIVPGAVKSSSDDFVGLTEYPKVLDQNALEEITILQGMQSIPASL